MRYFVFSPIFRFKNSLLPPAWWHNLLAPRGAINSPSGLPCPALRVDVVRCCLDFCRLAPVLN